MFEVIKTKKRNKISENTIKIKVSVYQANGCN